MEAAGAAGAIAHATHVHVARRAAAAICAQHAATAAPAVSFDHASPMAHTALIYLAPKYHTALTRQEEGEPQASPLMLAIASRNVAPRPYAVHTKLQASAPPLWEAAAGCTHAQRHTTPRQ